MDCDSLNSFLELLFATKNRLYLTACWPKKLPDPTLQNDNEDISSRKQVYNITIL